MDGVAEIYTLGGIALASEIPLPELPRWQGDAAAEKTVHIRIGAVPADLPEAVEVDRDCFATPSRYLLRIPGIARYFVSAGEEIVVDPDEHALPLDVRAYLLGTVFVVVCHQRGLLPLHASAIRCGHGVVAFPARSGQGKSSLAAHLAQRGFPIVADDVCLVDARGDGTAMVLPAAPWLKLWRASFENLRWRAEGLGRVFSEDDKYRLPLEAGKESAQEPQPIGTVVFLERGEAGARVEIREVARLEAIPMLMNLTHQAYLLEAIGKREENFLRCGRVLSQARAYRLIRPWGFAHMEPTIGIIESLLC